VIVLRAKQVEFDVTYINLSEKPDWFLEISPHGKVPVLLVDDAPLFESNAIAEYLDEVVPPRLHPEDPFQRARHRAWTDFVPDFSSGINIYYTKTKADLDAKVETAPARFEKLEAAMRDGRGNDGPYFSGPELCLVDAAYAPFLQRFAMVEAKVQTGLLKDFPLIQAWIDALLANEIVTGSVPASFVDEFVANLHRREFYVSQFFDLGSVAAE
jgi:glutathione S-transferase